jgi:DNA polymerase-4
VQFADAVASRLRAQGLVARTIQLKVRFGDFTTITRSTTLAVSVDDSHSLLEAGRQLLELVDPAQGVRLLGLSVSGLSSDSSKQLTFDEATSGPGWQEADRMIDEIRARFGDDAIGPAISAGPDGLRLKRRGNQQWGPDAEMS